MAHDTFKVTAFHAKIVQWIMVCGEYQCNNQHLLITSKIQDGRRNFIGINVYPGSIVPGKKAKHHWECQGVSKTKVGMPWCTGRFWAAFLKEARETLVSRRYD